MVFVLYRASPREVNRVRVVVNRAFPFSYRITDTAATIRPGAGCSRVTVHQVLCKERAVATAPGTVEKRTVGIALGDRNDILVAPSAGSTPAGLVIKGVGGAGADKLTGSELRGGPGNDVMFGYRTVGGTSHLYGDGGNDQIAGSAEVDVLSGGPGSDILVGRTGNDVLTGGPGIDLLFGGPGTDRLDGRIRETFRG